MIHTKSFIRLVASIVAAMLVLCQTAATAMTYAAPRAPAKVTAERASAETPCHFDSRAQNGSTPKHGCHDRCPARDASLETAQIHIPVAAALVSTVFTLVPALRATAVAAPSTGVIATAAPPPLLLLYCRLLN
jgi:hypothetical protein